MGAIEVVGWLSCLGLFTSLCHTHLKTQKKYQPWLYGGNADTMLTANFKVQDPFWWRRPWKGKSSTDSTILPSGNHSFIFPPTLFVKNWAHFLGSGWYLILSYFPCPGAEVSLTLGVHLRQVSQLQCPGVLCWPLCAHSATLLLCIYGLRWLMVSEGTAVVVCQGKVPCVNREGSWGSKKSLPYVSPTGGSAQERLFGNMSPWAATVLSFSAQPGL
jgi:hypothetical protein